jgi:hypothetical protein
LGHLPADAGHFCRGFAQRVIAFFILRYIEKKARLFEVRAVLCPRLDDVLERRLFSEKCLGLFSVVPEIRLGCELVQFVDALLLALDVKDASAIARDALPGGSVAR